MTYKLLTINIRGVNDKNKRQRFFAMLEALAIDFIFLQETYTSETDYQNIANDWRGMSIWNHGPDKHTNGTAILFKNSLNFNIIDTKKDNDGRILITTIEIEQEIIALTNIYAPTIPKDRPSFFKGLKEIIPDNASPIIAGDFNMVTDPTHDRVGPHIRTTHTSGMVELTDILQEHDLTDAWRDTHPSKHQYTYRKQRQTIQSRIDRIYLSKRLNYRDCKIIPLGVSDHDAPFLTIDITNNNNRETSWKLNNSILPLPEVKLIIENIATQFLEEKDLYSNRSLWWETFKKTATYHLQKISKEIAVIRRKEYTEKLNNLPALKNATNADALKLECRDCGGHFLFRKWTLKS